MLPVSMSGKSPLLILSIANKNPKQTDFGGKKEDREENSCLKGQNLSSLCFPNLEPKNSRHVKMFVDKTTEMNRSQFFVCLFVISGNRPVKGKLSTAEYSQSSVDNYFILQTNPFLTPATAKQEESSNPLLY